LQVTFRVEVKSSELPDEGGTAPLNGTAADLAASVNRDSPELLADLSRGVRRVALPSRHELAESLGGDNVRKVHLRVLDVATSVAPEPSFELRHGRNSTFFFDVDRLLVGDFAERRVLVEALDYVARTTDSECLACRIPRSGLVGPYPICFEVGSKRGLLVAAQTVSPPNSWAFLGGVDVAGQRTLIVSDAITTGTSVLALHAELARAGAHIVGVFNFVDREDGGVERLANEGIDVVSLITLTSLRETAGRLVEAGQLSDLAHKAKQFLDVTSRLHVVKLPRNRTPLKVVKFAVAPFLAPPEEAFIDFRLRDGAARRQARKIYSTVERVADAGAQLLVLPELSIPLQAEDSLRRLSADRDIVIVGGTEYDEHRHNLGFVAIEGKAFKQPKLVRSRPEKDVRLGDVLHIFKETLIGNFAVLVCSDQFDLDLLAALQGQIDFLIVCARNHASELADNMALVDSYRFRCQVLYVNESRLGGALLAKPARDGKKYLDAGTEEEPKIHELAPDLIRTDPTIYWPVPIPQRRPR
jgi:orotate phosphoribosyltransferase